MKFEIEKIIIDENTDKIKFDNMKIKELIIKKTVFESEMFNSCFIENLIVEDEVDSALSGAVIERSHIKNLTFKDKCYSSPIGFIANSHIENIDFNKLEIIAPNSFSYSQIENINWSKELVIIHDGAFKNSILPDEITLPENLQYIAESAFSFAKFEKMHFENKKIKIQKSAFAGVNQEKIDNFNAPIEEELITIKNNDKIYLMKSLIGRPEYDININSTKTIIMPYAFRGGLYKKINIKNVKELKHAAFAATVYATSIKLPKYITEIPDKCFYNAAVPVEDLDFTKFKKIGSNAFAYTTLEGANLDLSNCEEIGTYAFFDTALQYVILPAVEEIPKGAFMRNWLRDIKFNPITKTIGEGAFYNSLAMDKLEIPSNIENISEHAFSSLGTCEITLPIGLKNINENSFNFDELTIHAPQNIIQKYDFLKKSQTLLPYKVSLEELIEQGKTISEINQILKEPER